MRRPHVVGLTGGIGAGKSTCSAIAQMDGYPVFDADAACHEIWKTPDWLADVVMRFGDLGADPRAACLAMIEKDPKVLDVLYEAMKPYLKHSFNTFLDAHGSEPVVILDTPLLLEKKWDTYCDSVVVIMADAEVRWDRVKKRPGMTRAKFDAILSRQTNDTFRRQKATLVIDGHDPSYIVEECFSDFLSKVGPKHGIYPGTFDPVTRGHLQALEDALGTFDVVTALIANNPGKTPMFTVEERRGLMVGAFQHAPRLYAAHLNGRLIIDTDDGMLVHYAKKKRATHIIRGLRSLTDFDYEQQMNLINRRYAPDLRTWFVMADPKYQVVSSTYAKTIVRFGEDAGWLLTPNVEEAVKKKLHPVVV